MFQVLKPLNGLPKNTLVSHTVLTVALKLIQLFPCTHMFEVTRVQSEIIMFSRREPKPSGCLKPTIGTSHKKGHTSGGLEKAVHACVLFLGGLDIFWLCVQLPCVLPNDTASQSQVLMGLLWGFDEANE